LDHKETREPRVYPAQRDPQVLKDDQDWWEMRASQEKKEKSECQDFLALLEETDCLASEASPDLLDHKEILERTVTRERQENLDLRASRVEKVTWDRWEHLDQGD